MKKLTKKIALKICYDLWTWLVNNPDHYKSDWPGWGKILKVYGKDNEEFYHACPCCEFVIRAFSYVFPKDNPKFCQNGACPLAGFAWSKKPFACESLQSPFSKWELAETDRTSRKYAKKIADACKAALELEN